MNHTKLRQAAFASLFLLATPVVLAITPTPGITITSPTDGTVVRPGATVRVKVEIDSAVLQPSVIEVEPSMRVPGVIGIMPPIELIGPPYETDVAVPIDASGIMIIGTRGKTTNGDFIHGPEVKLYVIPDEIPISITLSDETHALKMPTPDKPLPHEYIRTISVSAKYANDISRRISGLPLFGTTYTSADTAIATVTPEGVVAPVAPGVTYITVAHKGLKAFAEIRVRSADGADLPPTDQTEKVAITASGFRLDRETGFYVQQVTVKNVSSLPLWFPLHLVTADLPPNVRLKNAKGKTDLIAPLNAPYVSLKTTDQRFFLPGSTAIMTMNFVNYPGVPITYTPRVFSEYP